MENNEQEAMKSADVILTQLDRIAVAVETLVRLAEDTELPDHPQNEEPPESTGSGFVFPENIVPLENLEKAYILHVLRKSNGNRTHTAKRLGISLRTLRNKLHELRLEEEEEEEKGPVD
jgi:DNA-binding NtrC family response regulator